MANASTEQSIQELVWRIPGRGVRLLVDLDAIEGNVAAIAANVSPSTSVMAVVKADGYGHGGPQSAAAAIRGGATWLGVATIAEGIELRRVAITAPILVLGPTLPGEAITAHQHQLHITIGAVDQCEEICRLAGDLKAGRPLGVHLKINTGMNRYGIDPPVVVQMARMISSLRELSLDGVFTHFAGADELDSGFTRQQAMLFARCLETLNQGGVNPGLVHASNSAALIRFRELDFDLVRPGIAIYGVRPGPGVQLFDSMRPALKVQAIVQRVDSLQAGEVVGYGGTFAAGRGMAVGLLAFGYADGYSRSLSNRAWVGFRGARFPVSGRVSMDQTTIGIPNGEQLRFGDVVSVAGDGSDGEPTFEELAELAGTIPYEILIGQGLRLPAFYHRFGRVVAHDNG